MTSVSDTGGSDRSTFRRYARHLEAWRRVEQGEITGTELIEAIDSLDAAVAAVEGRGFEVTPFAPQPELASAVGLDPSVELWVKDETGNVSGTHKARHLFGTALAHRLDDKTAGGPEVSGAKGDLGSGPEISPTEGGRGSSGGGPEASSAERDRDSGGPEAPYAIASCGNAALAAAVLARAVGRALDVYVPVWANPAVTDRITELGGRVVRCPRAEGVLGDPAHHAMKAAVAAGAVAFSCQGTDTPSAIDGARTLAYEMVDALVADRPGPARLDRVFVQVGGGALATALVTGLAASEDLDRLPVIHAVQPEGNHPLVRAWDRVTAEITGRPAVGDNRAQAEADESAAGSLQHVADNQARAAADGGGPAGSLQHVADNQARAAVAAELGRLGDEAVRAVGTRMAADPQRYMTPWETEPVSYATGILDDVAYDWTAVVEAMLRSGGHPVVAGEDDLRQAHHLARLHTGINVCPTGASGLGGLLALLTAGSSGAVKPGERVAVLFTGHLRPGDPDPLTPEVKPHRSSAHPPQSTRN